MQTPKIIFFGNEQLAQGIKPATPIFDALIAHHYQICGVILTNANTRQPFKIATVAAAHQVPVFYSKNSTEISDIIAQLQPDVGVLAAFGKIVPSSIIDALPLGILNIHPSLLPAYRGTTPIETALLNNDAFTGVSLMRLVKAMDAGPILGQQRVEITPATTKQSLYEQLSTAGANLLIDALAKIQSGTLTDTAQDESNATFTAQLNKTMSMLDPTAKSADVLSREIIAYAGFPKSKYRYFDISCTITDAHVADNKVTELDLRCKDGKFLVIDQLTPENSKKMTAQSFLNGRHL